MWELAYKESWALKNWCFWTVGWRRLLRLQGDQTSQSWRKSVLNIHWKDWCCSWSSNTLAPWCEELTHWKGPCCWERLRAGGEGDGRGWDGWMASPTWWAWVWAAAGVGDGQRGLACCSPRGHKESDTTEQLNWTEWGQRKDDWWQEGRINTILLLIISMGMKNLGDTMRISGWGHCLMGISNIPWDKTFWKRSRMLGWG